MYGELDGVVTAIASRQGHDASAHPMVATAGTAPPGADVRIVEIAGGSHYAMAEGYDGSTGRGYLEPRSEEDNAARAAIGEQVMSFVNEVTRAGER